MMLIGLNLGMVVGIGVIELINQLVEGKFDGFNLLLVFYYLLDVIIKENVDSYIDSDVVNLFFCYEILLFCLIDEIKVFMQ